MKAVPSCEVGALMVRDQGRADALAKDLEVPRAYSSVDDLLADDKLDAIYVSSPVNLHPEHAIAVAESGKHPADLKDMVSSPGGGTVEALLAFERGGFRAAVLDGVVAAYEKYRALGERG